MTAAAPAGCPLTPRQFQVMSRLAAGETYGETAHDLGLSYSTVDTHAHNAYRRLGILGRGRAAAVVVMKDSGWLGAPPRRPHDDDDSRDVTGAQQAYVDLFVRLCERRRHRDALKLAVAYELLIRGECSRAPPVAGRPDIDELLLRMARGLRRRI